MLANFAAGGAAINVLASLHQCRIEVVDVGVASDAEPPPGVRAARVRAGTRDILTEAAMTDAELLAALAVGEQCVREAAQRDTRILIAGDMGIGNTTAAACLICALTGATPEEIVGRGTGVNDAGLTRKRDVVRGALRRTRQLHANGNSPEAHRVLAELGGLEIAAMTGLYCEAARRGIVVLLDGFISAAAALVATRLQPGTLRWMLASHRSAETGHKLALDALGLIPLLDLGMRLGEGTGAALTLPLVHAALALHRDMATFASAGVATAGDAAS
jgi:nicotinate-nucleotide--dimethylbenzimidazole phosphoribosyltransferase